MFDLATHRDVIVINDPDEPQSLLDEDPMPHIRVNGERHKMPSSLATTSCGEEWHAAYSIIEREATWMDDPSLCSVCFTPHERAEAAKAKAARDRKATGESEPIVIRAPSVQVFDISPITPISPNGVRARPRKKK